MQAVNVIVNFVYSLVIVKLLGAAGYGEYAVFYNSLAFAVLFLGLNLPAVITFFVTNKRVNAEKFLVLCIIISLVNTGLLFFALTRSDNWRFSIHIFPEGLNKPLWIFFFCAQFLLLQLNQLLTAFLNAHKIFVAPALFSMVINIALVAFWGIYLSGLFSVDIALFDMIWWVSIFFQTIIVVYFIYIAFAQAGAGLLTKPSGIATLKLVGGFTIIVYTCNTLQFLIYKMDIWFVNYFLGTVDTGVYALALSLSQLIWILPNAVSSVLLNYYQTNNRESSMQLGLLYGNLSIYACLIFGIGLLGIYYYIIPLLYGQQFEQVFLLCAILFAGTIPFTLSIIIANLNSGIGYIRINLYATIFVLVIGIVLNIALIPVYGIKGAAIGKVISYVAGTVFHIVVTDFLYKLPWQQFFRFPRFKEIIKTNVIHEQAASGN